MSERGLGTSTAKPETQLQMGGNGMLLRVAANTEERRGTYWLQPPSAIFRSID